MMGRRSGVFCSNNATERSMWGVEMRSIEVFDLLRDTGKPVVARWVGEVN